MAFLLVGGRVLRDRILLDDNGLLKDKLWLDGLLQPAAAHAASDQAASGSDPIVLTTPLPINTCSVDSLRLLPGVGVVMASRIAEWRENGLRFNCREDLEKVRGIGPRLSARLDTLVIYGFAVADTCGG